MGKMAERDCIECPHGPLKRFVYLNMRVSEWFDRLLLPAELRVDGMMQFLGVFVPQRLSDGDTVVDLGSGKMPAIDALTKVARRLRVIGVDIDSNELARAPAGCYDSSIVGDITVWRGNAEADVAICSAVLEHVSDTAAALAAVASVLKPGGQALLFCPCRNAAFARLNLLLPQEVKLRLLDLLNGPGHGVGFPALYDRCTPREFERMAHSVGLTPIETRTFYMSTYASVFLPMHVVWRGYQALARLIVGRQACESFILVAIKER